MFTRYLYENTLTQGPTFCPAVFYPNGNWLESVDGVLSNHLFIGSEDDWNIFKGYLIAKGITVNPENWCVFPKLDSYVIRSFSTMQGKLFFYSRIEYADEYMSKYNKEVTNGFNEYCILNMVKKVCYVNTMEEGLRHSNYSSSIKILFVGTKEEEDLFKEELVALGYDPTKVKRINDVHSMFITYRGYSMRTYFFSSHKHVEKGVIPQHTCVV